MISVNAAFFVMVGYGIVYNVIAVAVLKRLNEERERRLGTGVRLSGYNPSSIIGMIFSPSLPEETSTRFVRYGIFIARAMVALYIPLIALVIYMADWAAE